MKQKLCVIFNFNFKFQDIMYKVKEEKEDVLSGEPTELESAVIKDEHEYMDKSPDIESLTQVWEMILRVLN